MNQHDQERIEAIAQEVVATDERQSWRGTAARPLVRDAEAPRSASRCGFRGFDSALLAALPVWLVSCSRERFRCCFITCSWRTV